MINKIISFIYRKRKGKCTICRFNCHHEFYQCKVGNYYASQGLNRICYEGELWKPDINNLRIWKFKINYD